MEVAGVTLGRVAASPVLTAGLLLLVFTVASSMLVAAHVVSPVVLLAATVVLVGHLLMARVVALLALVSAHIDGLLRTNKLVVAWRVLGSATVAVRLLVRVLVVWVLHSE